MNRTQATIVTVMVLSLVVLLASGCPPKPAPKAPKPECETNDDCPDGKECKSGKCVTKTAKAECSIDEDCPDPKVCKKGKCKLECIDDDGCGSGLACEDNRCVEPSNVKADMVCSFAPVKFDFDQYYISSEYQEHLRQMAPCLMQDKVKLIEIKGHCDERGTIGYNLALGEKRAKAVVDFLVDLGVPRSKINFRSMGEEQASRCYDEDCWANDRKGAVNVEE